MIVVTVSAATPNAEKTNTSSHAEIVLPMQTHPPPAIAKASINSAQTRDKANASICRLSLKPMHTQSRPDNHYQSQCIYIPLF
mmetsp:Transcript_32974/g.79774  ORF Transcript_32974/g.79774 Transcript_32974/m.79774 type:complete len:83 (+) Transcript_32974:716-964(+)